MQSSEESFSTQKTHPAHKCTDHVGTPPPPPNQVEGKLHGALSPCQALCWVLVKCKLIYSSLSLYLVYFIPILQTRKMGLSSITQKRAKGT